MMQAKYSGKCQRCDKHFSKGVEIERCGNGWKPVGCKGCEDLDRSIALIRRMEARGVSCGLSSAEGVQKIAGTRAEFLEIAERYNEDSNDIAAARRSWSSILYRDLFD